MPTNKTWSNQNAAWIFLLIKNAMWKILIYWIQSMFNWTKVTVTDAVSAEMDLDSLVFTFLLDVLINPHDGRDWVFKWLYVQPALRSTDAAKKHYCDVTIGGLSSQITRLTIVYPTVHSGIDQRKHQSSTSLASVRGIHRCPVNSPQKWPVTRKMFPSDGVIMDM